MATASSNGPQHGSASLLGMPNELLEEILVHTDIHTLRKMYATNHELRNRVDGLPRLRELLFLPALTNVFPRAFQPDNGRSLDRTVRVHIALVKHVGPLRPLPEHLEGVVHPFLGECLMEWGTWDIRDDNAFYRRAIELTVSAPRLLCIVNENHRPESFWRKMVILCPSVPIVSLELKVLTYAPATWHGGKALQASNEDIGVTLEDVIKQICEEDPA